MSGLCKIKLKIPQWHIYKEILIVKITLLTLQALLQIAQMAKDFFNKILLRQNKI